jgi:pimeloyl-ACP methyl ester carboxylesterase
MATRVAANDLGRLTEGSQKCTTRGVGISKTGLSTSYTWRRPMNAVAAAGYRAIAPDMRGYERSSAPVDANLYTPLQTTGDLIGLLDALKIPSAVLVGHSLHNGSLIPARL